MAGFKRMAARFGGKCAACGGAIEAGDMILWKKGAGARHADDNDCAYFAEEAAERRYFDSYGDADDWEAQQDWRDEAAYQQGYHEVRAIQAMSAPGSALREQMYLEMEQAAYNRGEDY